MKSQRQSILLVVSFFAFFATAWWCRSPQAQDAALRRIEDEIHRIPNSNIVGRPATVVPVHSGTLRLTVRDVEHGMPTFCRVNVIGQDGLYYEPEVNPLKPWSLSRLGNRAGKGPIRYYGWFFYTNGQCEVAVPAGVTQVEVWKGFEYEPQQQTVPVKPGEVVDLEISLNRRFDLSKLNWYSGDTHIHLDRKSPADDERALDLASAEDLRVAHILCMNDPRTYQPQMEQQIWHQLNGMGQKSIRQRGIYTIMSGQEYRCSTYGHICLLGGSRLVDADGLKTDPNRWPVFGMVADETHGIGGYAFHAHGGYEQEIYADFAQQATDGVELLQFAEYRGIGLEGWYHILNAGFRFPAVGASDYPYCRALGDCRTYAYLPAGKTAQDWNQAVAQGRSFFSTGPVLNLQVNGARPGDTLQHTHEGEISVVIAVRCLVGRVRTVQLIVGGQVQQEWNRPETGVEKAFVLRSSFTTPKSTWIALRAFGRSLSDREDVEAHTNPVYVSIGEKPIHHRASVEWLIKKLDQQILIQAARTFPERERVLAYYQKSRDVLETLLDADR